MTERPILFSGPLVRAILAGEKTETRRLVTPKSARVRELLTSAGVAEGADQEVLRETLDVLARECSPYGQPGDTLWVRETWRVRRGLDDEKPSDLAEGETVLYDADGAVVGNTRPVRWGKGRPSIFLPRWASRIDLAVTEVAAERLQEITDEGAKAEGVRRGPSDYAHDDARAVFMRLWDSINGKRPGASWDANPWVWVIKFQRLEPTGCGGEKRRKGGE